jgi:hypothetical protein
MWTQDYWLEVGMHPAEGPAISTGVFVVSSVLQKILSWYEIPRCTCMLLMQTFKCKYKKNSTAPAVKNLLIFSVTLHVIKTKSTLGPMLHNN